MGGRGIKRKGKEERWVERNRGRVGRREVGRAEKGGSVEIMEGGRWTMDDGREKV